MTIGADTPRATNGDARKRAPKGEPKQKRARRARMSTDGIPDNYRMLSTGLWWFANKEIAQQAE
jgi:hypothetical protein